jgi:hypothetical protein
VDSGLKMEGICGWGVSPRAQGAQLSAVATQQPTCRRIALFQPSSVVLRRMCLRSRAVAATEGLPPGITNGDGTSLTSVALRRIKEEWAPSIRCAVLERIIPSNKGTTGKIDSAL